MVTVARSASIVGIIVWLGMRAAVARDFDIDAGQATLTLNEFSRQSDLQVLFDFNALKERRTRQVRGNLTPQEALAQMLGDTDLTFDFVNERTLAVTLKDRIDSDTFARWLRRFEATAQAYAEGAAPAVAPLIIEIALTNETYTASR